MAIVNLSALAQTDLNEIWSYIAESNPDSADKVIDELFKKFQLLSKNSGLGKSRDNIIINLRSFPYDKFVVFYFPIDDGVEIYRILHSSRDINQLFSDYFEGLDE